MDEKTGYTITKATLTILIKYTIYHAISLRKDQQWQKQPKMTVSIPACKQKQTYTKTIKHRTTTATLNFFQSMFA